MVPRKNRRLLRVDTKPEIPENEAGVLSALITLHFVRCNIQDVRPSS